MPKSISDYSIDEVARIHGGDVHGSGAGRYAMVPGPGHGGAKDRSLRIDLGPQHPDGFLVYSHAGDDAMVCRDYVREKLSLPAFSKTNGKRRSAKRVRATAAPIQDPKPILESSDGMTPDERLEAAMSAKPGSGAAKDAIAIYDYKDLGGITRYQVRRYEPKNFIQYRPDGNGGWIPGLGKIEKLPYHLDKIAAQPNAKVYVFEGERDTDRAIAEFSICATTASGGGKWKDLAKHFKGRDLIIVPDHDAEGKKKGRQAATALHKVAASVRYVTLGGLSGEKPDKDFSDWLNADPARASGFIDLCSNAPLWPLEGDDDSRLERPQPVKEGISIEDFYCYLPTHQYLFIPASTFWPSASVDLLFCPIQKGDDLIAPHLWLDDNRSATQMTWAPGLPFEIPDKIINDGGWSDFKSALCLNLYKPPTIQFGDAIAAQPWIDHIYKIYPDEADHIISFLAHRVQRPGEKINHALFLGGNPGIGKDTLIEPVKFAVGPWNVAEISPKTMLGSFNGFVKSVILRISEARDLGDVSRYVFYDAGKTLMAAPPDALRVNEKNLKEYYVQNVCAVILTSNYKTDGLFLPADDRRHFVAWSDLAVSDFAEGYWNQLWGWYGNGGIENVAAFLKELDISNFNPKAPPRKTPAFWAIVDANQAPEEAEFSDVLDKLGWPDAVTIIELAMETNKEDFATWLRDRKNRRAIPHRLEKCGYVQVRNDTANSGLWRIRGIRQVVYAKAELTPRDRFAAAKALDW
jgi:hypothetical protein